MSYIKLLTEKRGRAWNEAKGLLDKAQEEDRDLSAEETQTYERIVGEVKTLDERAKSYVEAEKRGQDIDASVLELGVKPAEDRNVSESNELREYFSGKGGRSHNLRAPGTVDFRDLSKLSAGAGANTVETGFLKKLYEHMIEVSGLLQAGPTVLNTTSGEVIQIPKTTAHVTAVQVAETAAILESDPTFGQVNLNAYKYGRLIQVSRELVDDSSVDLLGYLARSAGRALGNAIGADMVIGDGSAKPAGVVPGATVGITGGAGVAGAFTYDNLIDLFHSVIGPYRNSTSAGWLVRDASLGAIMKLKDGDNRYIFQPSLTAGQPGSLLGKPVHSDPNVAAVGLGAKSVLFGDFSAYYVRTVNGVRFERSDEFAFGNDLVSFRALIRGDGALVDTTGALKVFVGNAA